MNSTVLKVINGTDKEIRCELHVGGESKGELMLERADFTRLADRLFDRDYSLVANETKCAIEQ